MEKDNLIKKKLINGIEITNTEIDSIKIICDYLFVDRVKDFSTFPRFEQCFGPLFSDKNDVNMFEVFKEICGPNKKYITFHRFLSSYLIWKSKKSKNKVYNNFMTLLFNFIIKKETEVIGELKENGQIFSTQNCQGRKAISKFGIFSDIKKDKIQGFILEYDDSFNANLSFRHEEDTPSLEINLKPYKVDAKYGKIFDNDRDGVSHIGGKYDKKEKRINFLIIKCRSGKTFYIVDNNIKNDENIELFLIISFTNEIKDMRIQTSKNQLNYLELIFQKSMRINPNLSIDFNDINEDFLKQDKLIFEENKIQKFINANNYIDKYILIPLIKDYEFMNKDNLKEIREGKKFHEIYNSKYNFDDNEGIKIFGESIIEEIKKMKQEQEKNENKDKEVKFISNGEFLSQIDDIDELLNNMKKDLITKK